MVFSTEVETAKVTRGTTIETIESGSQIYQGFPNLVAGESGYKRTMAEDDDLKELDTDMDRDLRVLGTEMDHPSQPVGDEDVGKWMASDYSGSKKQKIGSW